MSIPSWADEVRLRDRDRFLCALLAPDQTRNGLLALYAFNGEVARIRETVSEPLLGNIRLQWWRETIEAIYEGKPPNHEIAQALHQTIEQYHLPRDLFDQLLDAREFDMQDRPPEDMGALVAYAEGTASTLQELAVLIASGQSGGGAAKQLGIAWALTGLVRAVPFQASMGRTFLPNSLLKAKGLDPLHLSPSEELNNVVELVAQCAQTALENARSGKACIPPASLAAMLLAPLTESYLKQLSKVGHNPFDAKMRRGGTVRQLKLAWYSLRKIY
ncbi:MAG: squalene/phytoene synthase family protein [Rhodospirillales bacterium]|nr:squalene/phytoene synthase family protein [Rhodospirillales bacterium]